MRSTDRSLILSYHLGDCLLSQCGFWSREGFLGIDPSLMLMGNIFRVRFNFLQRHVILCLGLMTVLRVGVGSVDILSSMEVALFML